MNYDRISAKRGFVLPILTQAALKAGDTTGTTRLGIEVEDGPLFDGIVATDNYGNTYTGRGRASGFFRLNNPLGMGDQLSLSGVLTQHSWSDSFHVGWDAPVGYDGLRLGVAYDPPSVRIVGTSVAVRI
ncbi:MAG: ShlB/FhaC/HecB family hemolysin secretion/activation protein [Acidithiobacillus sp.]